MDSKIMQQTFGTCRSIARLKQVAQAVANPRVSPGKPRLRNYGARAACVIWPVLGRHTRQCVIARQCRADLIRAYAHDKLPCALVHEHPRCCSVFDDMSPSKPPRLNLEYRHKKHCSRLETFI